MEEIRVDLIIEPGTPFEFLEKGKMYVISARNLLSHLTKQINAEGGYVEIKQRIDGNFSVKCWAKSKELSELMTNIIVQSSISQ